MKLKHGKKLEWHCLYWLMRCKYNNPNYHPWQWYPYRPLLGMVKRGKKNH